MTSSPDVLSAAYKPALHAMVGALNGYLAAAARNGEMILKAINDSAAEASEIEKAIEAAQDVSSLLELQARLARSGFERAVRNWSLLCEAAGEIQLDALRRGQSQMAHLGEEMRAATLKNQPRDMSLAGWGSFLEAVSSACALTAKATEEMTRMATAQGANLEAMAKHASKPAARAH